MNALIVASTALRRYLRDRRALFFVVVLPVLVIVIVGTTVSGADNFRVAVVNNDGSALAASFDKALTAAPALTVSHRATVAAARTAVRRGEATVGIVIPRGFSAGLRAGHDQTLVEFADTANPNQQAGAAAVASAIATESARIQAAQFAASYAGTFDANLAAATSVEAHTVSIEVSTRTVDTTSHYLPNGFDYSAPTMLVLFVFINALAGGSAIIESRRLGMYERMMAAPLSSRSIVVGETLCYLSMALLQSVLIVGIGAIVFGVDWGDPFAAGALVLVWALVGTGCGVLSGTLFRTPQQAAAIGPSVGIALGMLGGCMWPLEIVPKAMRMFGHAFPHAWAVDAWTTVMSRGGDVAAIATPLLVLGGFAAALIAIAMARLQHTVAR